MPLLSINIKAFVQVCIRVASQEVESGSQLTRTKCLSLFEVEEREGIRRDAIIGNVIRPLRSEPVNQELSSAELSALYGEWQLLLILHNRF
jgi:hypothetical protein